MHALSSSHAEGRRRGPGSYTGRKRKFNCALLVSEMYCKCELSCSCQQFRKDGILFSISGYTTRNDRAKFPVLNSSPLSHLKHHV